MPDELTTLETQQAIEGDFSNVGRVHDWRNYISDELRGMWSSFTKEQRLAIAAIAAVAANNEEWD